MKNRTVLLYMTFVFLSNFSTILYFLTVYLEFVGFSMVAISSMMIAYQVSKFILEVPTGYIADRFGRKASGLVGVVGMLGYYAALLLVRSPLLLIGAFALKGFAVACVSGSIEAIYIDSVSQDQLVRLNVVERFVFYASYAISACVGGFISSVGAYLIGLSADVIAMVLTLVVVACIPEMRRGGTAATPKRGISPKMIGAAIACNGLLRSAFIMDCSQAFAFVTLEDFFSLLLAGRGMSAVASGVTIAVQLLVSASIGFIVPSVIARVDKGRFARICGIVRFALTAAYANQRMPFKYLSTWICIMLTVRMVLGPGIGGAIYSNVLQERQQHYITRYAQNVDLLNPDASTSFLGTVQGMKYQGKSETEACNMAAISTKGRIQVQATLSALKEMAGWTIYGGLICMIFVLVVPYPKRKLLT